MRVLWDRGQATADEVRIAMTDTQPLADSSIRTILRRLEQKDYVTHATAGRTFIYKPKIDSRNVAVEAVRGIIDRFCAGSVEDLLVGMVDQEIVSSQKLQELAKQISRAESANRQRKSRNG
jgi:predicted transcriptional regulator